LATNLGFSAAITNPFTIGVAQRIAGLPLFSGTWLRIPIFLVVYAVLAIFLTRYARRVERNPESSLSFEEDRIGHSKYHLDDTGALADGSTRTRAATFWFLGFFLLIVGVLVSSPFIPVISDYALPIVGLLFLIGGIGAGILSGTSNKRVMQAAGEGLLGIAPGIPLILMAASVKHIIVQGSVMDSILYAASGAISDTSPFAAILTVYAIALVIELAIGSACAKAFLIMPIILPLADLVGITRQLTVTAYCFGDGFSNMAYPTNPVLLICLGLATTSYAKWMKWTAKLWLAILAITVAFLGLGVAIGYGPF
jgi:uncharacterized ion transporter superfamily protein YfcC